MPTVTYGESAVPVDDEGFFTDPAQWTEPMAEQIAPPTGTPARTSSWAPRAPRRNWMPGWPITASSSPTGTWRRGPEHRADPRTAPRGSSPNGVDERVEGRTVSALGVGHRPADRLGPQDVGVWPPQIGDLLGAVEHAWILWAAVAVLGIGRVVPDEQQGSASAHGGGDRGSIWAISGHGRCR
ncbi:TusE/DsrC/DsvC family sulfur relay protein [Streptomyces sp. NBC_00481]|uniref:hypothetical protein n=1 Tax=Streptomyces sp. NBC_00481 TaxID=2975755 RepID=UPI002DD7F7E4|nr:hypothetical protein [Streptomyces sp. NBC_00481]WRY95199.1 TusE/DsrC/DsvC family sulfur relay protein [Streptomyces sp. NBC_00481]